MKSLLLTIITLMCSHASAQTADELRSHVEYLASDELGGRYTGSEGMKKAIAYVKAECKGLKIFTQPVGTCQNTIAVLPGRTEDRIVVGAHLDHIGQRGRAIYNGADDNASGCALVLALAKRLKGQRLGCTVEFHFYTGEEQGMVGSKQYVRRPIGEIEQYKFMLNLDMVGRLQEERLIGKSPFPFEKTYETLCEKYSFAKKVTWVNKAKLSDHGPWVDIGVPAVMINTGLHNDYHTPADDADRIDYNGMVKISKYAFDFVLGVDKELHPQVNEPPYVLF